jgi:GTP 3',8-cyclase
MLVDNFNRTISYVRISITDRCNLRCKYCTDSLVPYIPHDDVLRYEEILRFVRIGASLGLRKVRLTGGEPLRRKGLPYLIRQIKVIDSIEDISLTTNGVELASNLDALKDAGLTRLNISLDSLKPERFAYITGLDAFGRVMDGIEKAIEKGLHPVKVNTVIMRGFNDDEVLDLVAFAGDKGIDVRFIEFMPFSDEWDDTKVISSAELESMIRSKYNLVPSTSSHRGPAKMFHLPGGRGQVGFISPMSSHICGECNRIRLTPDGKLKPCLFSDSEYDIKALFRGNAGDEEIADFIRGVVGLKPEKKFEQGTIKKCQRSMRNTGG